MKNPNYINKLWQTYFLNIVPRDAEEIQQTETKKAFYAGALSLYQLMLGMMEEGSEPTDNDLRKMQWLDEELAEYIKQNSKS